MIKTLMKNIFTPLLKRIQALEYSLGLIADYVVETGTDGIWTYEKKASGIAKCWGSKVVSVAISNTWGQCFQSNEIAAESFPSGLFTSVKTCEASANGDTEYTAWIACRNGYDTVQTQACILIRGTTQTTAKSFTINYEAKGTWK